MFISQVTFEIDINSEDLLKTIMKKKTTTSSDANGIVSVELWRNVTNEVVGYTLVTKWESKECFKEWFANEHKGKKPSPPSEDRPKLNKKGMQYEVIDINTL